MNSEQLPEIRRRNSAKNGSSRDNNSGTNQILPATVATSTLDSQSPQTSEGKKMGLNVKSHSCSKSKISLKSVHYKRHAPKFLPCKNGIHYDTQHEKFAISYMKLPWCNG